MCLYYFGSFNFFLYLRTGLFFIGFTPSLTFSTTVAPIYQVKCIPHFIDVIDRKYIANVDQIEKCINKKTVAIMIPNLLGNIADWKKIYALGRKYKLKIIEDSADTIGYEYHNSTTGKLSDAVSTSFYGAHLITGAGFGGLVCFNDKRQYIKAKLLRSWGRSSSLFDEKSEKIENRFNIKLDGISYDKKFVFEKIGHNLEPSELGAAFGLVQLKKLKTNLRKREINFNLHTKFLKKYSKYFILPKQLPQSKSGWLAYPITITENAPFSRTQMQIFLEKKNIQTRVVFTGNILRQPGFKNIKAKKDKKGYPEADKVMKNGILIACHHGLTRAMIKHIHNSIDEFLLRYN